MSPQACCDTLAALPSRPIQAGTGREHLLQLLLSATGPLKRLLFICLGAVLENVILDQICERDAAVALPPEAPPVDFQPQTPEFRIPEEEGRWVICFDQPDKATAVLLTRSPPRPG